MDFYENVGNIVCAALLCLVGVVAGQGAPYHTVGLGGRRAVVQ